MRLILRALALLAATLGIFTAGPGGPANAHPFGDPSVGEVSLEAPDTLRVRWKFGMTDDLTYLAQHLELLPRDRVLLDGAVFFDPGDQELLAGSSRFSDYLLERISASTPAGDCAGEIVDIDHLVDEGVTLDFTCPGTISGARVRLAMLTDMNPAYKTMTSGPDGQKQVYDGDHGAHDWTFSSAAAAGTEPGGEDLGRSAAWQLSLVGLGVVAVGGVVAGLLWVRRRAARTSGKASDDPAEAAPVREHALSGTPWKKG